MRNFRFEAGDVQELRLPAYRHYRRSSVGERGGQFGAGRFFAHQKQRRNRNRRHRQLQAKGADRKVYTLTESGKREMAKRTQELRNYVRMIETVLGKLGQGEGHAQPA